MNLSRHKDDPIVTVKKKLQNRNDSANNCIEKVRGILGTSNPSLVTLKCLSKELGELHRFYCEQSSYNKWATPPIDVGELLLEGGR